MTSRYTYPSRGGSPPPPSYRANADPVQVWHSSVHGPPTPPCSREDTPLLFVKPQRHRFHLAFFATFALSCILISAMLSVVSFQASANSQRSSWAREIRQHDEQRAQIDQERLSWQDEIRKHANDSLRMGLDRARWDHERDLWEIERKQWAEEQRQRNVHRPFWGPPQRVSDRCLTYGTREYTAKLYNILTTENWADKCAKTAIDIKGRTHASPLRCEDHGLDEGIHGYWLVNYEELECEPAWEKFWKGDCDHLPGHRRWESLLWNIHPGDDVYELCRSTPVTLPTGHYFATAKCEDRRNSGPRDWRGWLGKWDVPDSTCNN